MYWDRSTGDPICFVYQTVKRSHLHMSNLLPPHQRLWSCSTGLITSTPNSSQSSHGVAGCPTSVQYMRAPIERLIRLVCCVDSCNACLCKRSSFVQWPRNGRRREETLKYGVQQRRIMSVVARDLVGATRHRSTRTAIASWASGPTGCKAMNGTLALVFGG